MCLGWMDYCFRFFLICLPPPPCPGSSLAPSYVIVDWVSLRGGLLNWKLVMPLPPEFSPVAGHWLFFFLFSFFFLSGKEVLISNWSLNLLDFVPPLKPALHPRRSGEFQHSHGAVVHPATWQDQISKLFYVSLSPPPTLEPAPRSTLYSLHPFCFLYLIIFLLMLLLRLLLFEKLSRQKVCLSLLI